MKPILSLFLVAALSLASFTACSTTGPDAAKNASNAQLNAIGAQAADTVWKFVLSETEPFVAAKVGDATATALFDAAGKIDSKSVVAGAAAVQSLVKSASGSKTLATVASQAYASAAPTTPAESAMALNSIGAAVQTAANGNVGVFDNKP